MADLDKVRRMMLKSFDAISKGAGLDDLVYDHLDLGREMAIGNALTYGQGLSDDFDDDEFVVVRRAFERFKADPPSKSPPECCADILGLAPRGHSE
jgi:hypothetical protein